MADTTPSKGTVWSDTARYQLVLRVLAQYRERSTGRGIQWDRINMPGRTTKSMSNIWTKINREIEALEQENPTPPAEGGAVGTPKKRGRPTAKAKKQRKGVEEDAEVDDEEDGDDFTPSKRRATGAPEPKREMSPFSDVKEETKELNSTLVASDLESPAAGEI